MYEGIKVIKSEAFYYLALEKYTESIFVII